MRRVFLAAVILGCAVLVAGLVTGQQQTPKPMTMEVSIVATVNDAPVEDLKFEDITVKDNNKKQDIVSFEKLAAGAPATPGKPRLYNVVLLDCMNTTYRDLPENRAEMLRVLNELTKADNLTFLVLWQKLRVVEDLGMQPPTLMSRLVSQGFQGLDGPQPNLEPYNWVFTDQLGLYQLFTPAGVFDGRRIEDSMGVLRTIASHYQALSGRKNLYWISQGFPITVGADPVVSHPRTLDRDGLHEAAGSGNRMDDLKLYAKDNDFAIRVLTTANVAVYPIDARYLSTTDTRSSDRSTMQDLAKGTGGLAYLSRGDVANCVREALNDTRTTYVLDYALPGFKYDGNSHAIKLETTRSNVKLRYRDGYYAPTKAPQ
jgi:VWFA-related protein